MTDVAELNVKLTESGASQVVASLSQVEKAVAGTSHSTVAMGAAMGATASVVTGALGAMTGAFSALGDTVSSVVKLSSSLEQAGIAFTTMLGSAEAAGAFLKELQEFAASTPFEFPQLVDASRKLMAFGFSAKEVIPMLTGVGNAVSAMGGSPEVINRVVVALGQIQSKGKLMAEEMMQLTETNTFGWRDLAKVLGVDVPTAQNMVTKGLVSSDVAIKAFMQSSQKFGNMMEAQSHTLAGAFSTIKDVVSQLAVGAFKPFYDVLSGMTDRLAQFAQSETVSIWAEDLKITLGALTPLFSSLGAWLESQLPAAMSAAEAAAHGFTNAVQAIAPQLQAIASVVGPMLATAWERITAVLGTAAQAFGAIAPLLGTVFEAVNTLSSAVNGVLAQALSFLGAGFENLGRIMAPVGEALARFFKETDTSGLSVLQGIFDAVGSALGILGDAINTFNQSWQIVFVEGVNIILPKLEELRSWLGETLPPVIATLQEAWDGFWSHAGPMVQAMWNIVQPIIGGLIGAEIAILQKALETFKTIWDTVWGGITAAIEKIAPLVGALASTFGGAFAGLSDTITAALSSMQAPVAVAAEEVGTTIKNEIIKPLAPMGAEVAAATAPAAEAVAQVGKQASAATPPVTALAAAATGTATASAKAATVLLTMADAEKQLADEATRAANAVTLAGAKGPEAFVSEVEIAGVRKALDALTASFGPDIQGWVKYMEATEQAGTALYQFAEQQGLNRTLLERAADGDVAALKKLQDQIAATRKEAETGIPAPSGIGAIGIASAQTVFSGYGASSTANAWEAMERRILEGAPATGQRAGQALGQGVQAGVVAATPAISSAVTSALSAGATRFRESVGGRMSQNTARNPEIDNYIAAHPNDVPQLLPDELARLRQQLAGLPDDLFSAALNAAQDARISQFARAEAARNAPPKPGQAEAAAAAAAERAKAEAALAGQAANNLRYSMDKAALGVTQLQMDILKMGLAADSAGQGMDFAGAASARAGAAALQMSGSITVASAAAQAAAEGFKVAAANAAALMSGAMRNAGVAGGVTEKGLTYTQIMAGTPGAGGGVGGSNQGVGNLPPGNYYGIPVVSPVTGGTLRGFADGGWVTEPHYLVNTHSGNVSGIMAEKGPERIGNGDGGVTVIVNVQAGMGAGDVIQDTPFWNRVVDGPFTQALTRRFPTLGR